MNVLLVTSQMDSGGAETHIFELAVGLAERGHNVSVASAGGRLATGLCREGISHVTLPLASKSPISLGRAYAGLYRLIKKRRFHIVHAHSRLAAYLCKSICESQGVPMVTTVHARYRTGQIYDSLSRWGDGVIAVSQDLYCHLLTHGRDIPLEHTCVIPNGIDTERFSPSTEKRNSCRVAFMSRLDADCSHSAYLLCDIAERLWDSFGASVVIGGGGGEYGNVLSAANTVNARVGRKIIDVVGHIDDTVSFLREADVFVGVSRAALEAMSCGVPVVLSGDEGFLGVADGETLRTAETSNFCCRGYAEASAEALYGAIAELLGRSDEQRRHMGTRLREYVLRYHCSGGMVEKTETFYRRVERKGANGKYGVLLCGYYGFDNMGDDILLMSAARRATREYSSLPVCALTRRGKRDSAKYGVRCASRASFFTLIREIRRARIVVLGGGTLLQNSTSDRSLLYYLFVLRFAELCAKRVELWGNGIGEIKGRVFRKGCAAVLSGCAYVGLRDRESLTRVIELIDEHGYALPRVCLEKDLAVGQLGWDELRTRYLLDRLGIRAGERFAIIALRGVEKKGYVRILERWIRRLVSVGITPMFVVMYPRQELELSRKLCRSCGGVLAYPILPSDLFGLVSRAALVCSMRYHPLVLAAEAGKAFIGFGSEDRVESFCHSDGGVYFTELEGI